MFSTLRPRFWFFALSNCSQAGHEAFSHVTADMHFLNVNYSESERCAGGFGREEGGWRVDARGV